LGLLTEEKASVSGISAVMREAQEVEHLRRCRQVTTMENGALTERVSVNLR
jgi:hypothetical protein